MWVPVERREAWVRRSHSPVWRGFAALLAGALPAFAFPESNIAWFAYIALVPWMVMLRTAPTGRRAFLDGWIGGLGFMLAVHQWLIPSLHVFILVLGGFLGLLWGPWGWLVRFMLRGRPSVRRTVAALAVLPSGWLIIETVRSLDGLGGPWGLLGASQWDVAPALRLASVGGVWLVSLLVVAVNTALTVLLTVPPVRTTAVAGLTACVVAVGVAWVWAPLPENAGHARVAIVQPGVIGGIERRFVRSEELTRSLAGQDLDLVVWGESSVGRDLTTRPDLANRVVELSRQVGSPVLVNMDAPGSDEAGRTGIFKSAVLVGPDGLTGDRYDKMRLVPFGEYIPMRDALGWATSVGKAASQDRRRGTHQAVMVLPGPWQERLRIGPLICFESAFPDMSRQLVRDGAQLLVAQSSTSTFQQSWAPEQHATLAALRAAETGRPTVHATLTGVSAVYGPEGKQVGTPLSTDRSTSAVYVVPLARGTTAFVNLGPWPLYGALAVLAALCAFEGARSLRRPARERPAPHAHTARASKERPGR
ncbi:apolipoprotein N-acyltransferase [Streptomyces camponoticapitis]|uniref:Apolipoprotein N-acyltransferase n=1 Tax=Streptomyces camponoticapitis TaxID=1616125 RepID=A0ABQ2EU04_9ACTN|nr:apolipoprotein N-acyltransferase [Streptomyces camponoticapitis]GGK25683.1 apolipoprotein N-acyltransferase [Streptomyces camponoticapitis]